MFQYGKQLVSDLITQKELEVKNLIVSLFSIFII